jgi:hypothetical protein
VQCTVVVLNWNGRQHLPACLQSLRNQRFRDFEIVLVDNGSTDGSADWVRNAFPEIELLRLPHNLGFAAANNRAIKNCRTPWIALLNNDTEADAQWLQVLMDATDEHRGADFFASEIRLFDRRDLLDSAGDGFPIAGAAFKIGHCRPAIQYHQPKPVFGASAAAALYRTSMLRKLGGFDEDFFYIYEDADLNLRAQLAGHCCLYVPGAVVYHKVNASLKSDPASIVFYGQRNSEWLIWKNLPARLLLKYLPLRVLYFFISLFYFTFRGRLFSFLKAKHAAWKGRARMLEKRTQVQRLKCVSDEYIDSLLEHRWLRTRFAGKL